MKKIVKLASVAMMVLMATSCCKCNENSECDAQKQACEATCSKQQKCHKRDFKKCPDMEKWAKFDELSEAEQKDLIAKRKAKIDSIDAARKAAFEKFKKDWENFDSLSIDEQKKLLDFKSHFLFKNGYRKGCPKHCHKGMHKCCHKGMHKGCPKAPKAQEK